MKLTIVIPTYNEAGNLPGVVTSLLSSQIHSLSIIVVDDNSPDGTGQIGEDLAQEIPDQIKVIHRERKLGLGSAYIEGFELALNGGAQYIAQMDADFSHPPEMLPVLLDALRDSDLAIGSRYISGGSVDVGWPYWRKALSSFGNLYARSILNMPVSDLTSGFKMWRRETLLGIPLEAVKSNGYSFQIEMNYLAHRLGYSIMEVPFYFPERKIGESKMSLNIQLEAAIRVWQIRSEYRDLSKN